LKDGRGAGRGGKERGGQEGGGIERNKGRGECIGGGGSGEGARDGGWGGMKGGERRGVAVMGRIARVEAGAVEWEKGRGRGRRGSGGVGI